MGGVLRYKLEVYLGESLRGNTIGQQDREPLRGKSASERVSEREVFRVILQRFSEVFRDFQRFWRGFRGPLRDPLRGRFPSQRLSVLLPLFVLPLELSPSTASTFQTSCTGWGLLNSPHFSVP